VSFKYSDRNVIAGKQLGDLYQSLVADFSIVTIEDPFDSDVCKIGACICLPLFAKNSFFCSDSLPRIVGHSKSLGMI
jgi:Enolase, C-terminal TIM barrel domain